MDNRIFNVNGIGDDFLSATIKLAFDHAGVDRISPTTCAGWRYSKKSGLILFSYDSDEGINKLPKMNAKQIVPFVIAWLNSDEAKEVELEEWEDDYDDGDVSSDLGWRVFVEDWGHVDNHWGVICAIKPAYLWHGK